MSANYTSFLNNRAHVAPGPGGFNYRIPAGINPNLFVSLPNRTMHAVSILSDIIQSQSENQQHHGITGNCGLVGCHSCRPGQMHYCNNCNITPSNHLSRDCPTLRRPIRNCGVLDCGSCRQGESHICRHCNACPSNHFSRDCPSINRSRRPARINVTPRQFRGVIRLPITSFPNFRRVRMEAPAITHRPGPSSNYRGPVGFGINLD
jgi:hypothetical protein